MLSVSEASNHIRKDFSPVEAEFLPLSGAAGRVLASDFLSNLDLPPFDNSSVDGFAVQASEISAASPSSPLTLKVVADIRAGAFSKTAVGKGEAARIMTGAALPSGANAVVMVEDTGFNDREPGSLAPAFIEIMKSVGPGENIRRLGGDLHSGDKVLSKGTLLRAQEIGLLAMLGQPAVNVFRKPRLALLSSGDELLPVESPLVPGKIHDANSYLLAVLAEKAGVEIIRLGVAADRKADVRSRLERAVSEKADLIVSSAGVSVGAFDYLRSVVEADGELDFWKVDLRPGKPFVYGKFHGIPFFGLPGNPVSAFIGFELFVRPAVEKLAGLEPGPRVSQKAYLTHAVESDGRESYLRAVVRQENGRLTVRLTGHQGSGNIFSLVQANALLIVPSGVKSLPANSDVDIWLLD
jgi:molybdopterin molybdotransferase